MKTKKNNMNKAKVITYAFMVLMVLMMSQSSAIIKVENKIKNGSKNFIADFSSSYKQLSAIK